MSRMALAKRRAAARGQQASLSGASAIAGAAPGAGAAAPGTPPSPTKPGSNFHPRKVLDELDTKKVLTGKDLRRGARALTMLEVRPQVHGYSLLAKQLHNERETEAQGLGNLGTRVQGNVSDVYKNIAQSEADSLARQQAFAGQLNATSQGIAQQGAQGLADVQGNQVADVTAGLQMRGAPGGGGAQQELADAVASQQASQNANSQAARQFAAQQGAGYGQLQAGLAGATQMQGGAAVGGIGQAIIGRVADSNTKYDQSIQTARQKLADVKATKGATFAKNLLGLRESEQKFLLGKQAVQGDKEAQKLAEKENAQDRKQQKFENKLELKKFGLAQWEATHPNASEDKTNEKKQEIRGEIKEVKSMIPSVVAELGRPPKNKHEFNILIGHLNSKASAEPSLVQKVLTHWWTERTQGNRGNPDATKVPYAP